MKTYTAKKEEITHNWYLVDAENQILGRLAAKIAPILRGKNKPSYTPYLDCGDGVIVINAEKIKVTGNKLKDKVYYSFSGYPGGQKIINLETRLKRKPTEIIRLAVKRMLPDTPLGRDLIKKLKIYTGPSHPHQAQYPIKLEN
jgi:large subunit ribosomal protein L13